MAKNRKLIIKNELDIEREIRIDELAKSLTKEDFEEVELNFNKSKTVWSEVTARIRQPLWLMAVGHATRTAMDKRVKTL
uniref:Uncharacterized protein n=1 Tax=Moorena producens (strain JHB) TaxID=1454205 RepID=A0A1D9G8P0_MOOP1